MPNDEIKLARIERKLDHVLATTSAINTTMAVQAEQLSEHMRRTKANEDSLEVLKTHNMRYAVGIIGTLFALVVALWLKHV